MKNFDLDREIREQSEKDWKFGATSQPGLVSIPENERQNYLPVGELQFGAEDFQDCASRSPVNHLEALFTYHYKNKMKPANKLWLEGKGYIKDGKVTFSDRFIAVLSQTTRTGNSLKAPLEAIRKNGLIPKWMLPKEEWMRWSDYHDPAKITPEMKKLGKEFAERFTLNYEQVYKTHFGDVLKDDMVGVAGYAWPQPTSGVYPKTEGDFNHAFLLFKLPKYQAFDNYLDNGREGDFIKNLASDYSFYDYGYRMYLSAETTPEEQAIIKTAYDSLFKNGLIAFFIDWYKRFTNT